jgi:hypothetical protein
VRVLLVCLVDAMRPLVGVEGGCLLTGLCLADWSVAAAVCSTQIAAVT